MVCMTVPLRLFHYKEPVGAALHCGIVEVGGKNLRKQLSSVAFTERWRYTKTLRPVYEI